MDWQNFWAVRVAQWWTTGFDLLLTPTDFEPPATLEDLTPPQDKPWKLVSKIGQAPVLHFAIQRNRPTRNLVSAALDP